MFQQLSPEQLLASHLQLDASLRPAQSKVFWESLAAVTAIGGAEAAWPWARQAVNRHLDYSSLMRLRRFLVASQDGNSSSTPHRIAILGGPTTIQLRQLIEAFLMAEGLPIEIYEGEYGLFRQEILTPGSELDRFGPQIVFLATSARDVARLPEINADEDAVAQMAAEELAAWQHLWQTAKSSWNATVLQNNFEIPFGCVLGHYTLRHAAARENYLERLNRLMAERAPRHVVLHDLRGLAAEVGAGQWFDPRFYYEFKMPCGAESMVTYAHSVASLMRAVFGRSRKVAVLDLDNTLWGGQVGDAGAGGIHLGQGSGEGESYLAFQRYLKDLQQRGIVLAVCSKNDEQTARGPFEQREDMVLKLSDFACFVANYENKADNLRTIAERLHLKLDSFVFVDDNPAERAVVRRCLPEVAVPDMPTDPAGYIDAVARHRYFETASLTQEDAARARYYSADSQRQDLAAKAANVDAFLKSLDMRMAVGPVDELNLERAAQLLNKSNQFNLTTRRYTAAQVREMANSPEWRTLTFRLRDSLGDNGLISVILLRREQNALAIDAWVMSCRVLLRGVEQFARNELVALAREEGCDHILGTHIPTPKNAMVKDHYAKMQFAAAGRDGETTHWALDLREEVPSLSHYIRHESLLCEAVHG